jgi:tungstate transport system substrate-binding protein
MMRAAPVFLAVAALVAGSCRVQQPPVVLATTTSVVNSGLLGRLLPGYEERTGTRLRVVPVGSGRAIRMLALGQADVVITHAPQTEAAALAAHPEWSYAKIMFNDFLIAGPPADPAGIARAPDAIAALLGISASRSRWITRGDESGTHERERELWRLAGVQPDGNRLVTSGQGMGATLRIANEMGAYTLTDRGTFEQLSPQLRLKELSSGDPRLLNTYAVLAPTGNEAGMRFARWIIDGEGHDRLTALIAGGVLHGFRVWPAGKARDRPEALPY